MQHNLLSRDVASSAVADLVYALHATPQRAVIEVAGAGTLGVSWLHAVGGSSRTVLEATDRYCCASLASLLGAMPAHAVAGAVAVAMAEAARRRARLLAGEETPVIGAACTAALASDRPRRGADRAFVAVAGALGTSVCELAFPAARAGPTAPDAAAATAATAARAEAVGPAAPADAAAPAAGAKAVTAEPDGPAAAAEGGGSERPRAAARQRQEAAASAVLVAELSRACGVDPAQVSGQFAGPPAFEVCREFHPSEPFAALESGHRGAVMLNAAGQVETVPVDWQGKALLSGAYHPLHRGHRALGDAAATFLGREVVYELPLVNADKAPIALSEAQRRTAQFATFAPVVLSRTALFADKAALFPGAVFVVGADTAERLIDKRFYGGSADSMDAALATLAERGCGLLVAGRRMDGRYLTLSDLAARIPAAHRGLFQELPEALFRYDISSTELRSRRTAAASPACR